MTPILRICMRIDTCIKTTILCISPLIWMPSFTKFVRGLATQKPLQPPSHLASFDDRRCWKADTCAYLDSSAARGSHVIYSRQGDAWCLRSYWMRVSTKGLSRGQTNVSLLAFVLPCSSCLEYECKHLEVMCDKGVERMV